MEVCIDRLTSTALEAFGDLATPRKVMAKAFTTSTTGATRTG